VHQGKAHQGHAQHDGQGVDDAAQQVGEHGW
jgi:hypothetical protein